MTVAMEPSPALHHSAQPAGPVVGGPREEDVHETNDGQRAPKRPPPGTRPALPSEVAEPRGAAATFGYVAAGVPLLSPVVLVNGVDHDGTTVRYLLAASQQLKNKEEEMRSGKRKASSGYGSCASSFSDDSDAGMCEAGFAGDDVPQAGFHGDDAPRARPVAVGHDSGTCKAGFAGDVSVGTALCSDMCRAGFPGLVAPRACLVAAGHVSGPCPAGVPGDDALCVRPDFTVAVGHDSLRFKCGSTVAVGHGSGMCKAGSPDLGVARTRPPGSHGGDAPGAAGSCDSRPRRVCCHFLESRKVAPSLTQELGFIQKPQLESASWLPSSTIQAVELDVWLGGARGLASPRPILGAIGWSFPSSPFLRLA